MKFEEVLNKHKSYDAAEGSGFIFLMPIDKDAFDHTMYRFPIDKPDDIENYDYIHFILDGYDDADSDVKPIPFEEVLTRYSQK